MTIRSRASLLVALVLVAACGVAQPSPELRNARNAYERARSGPAAEANPAGLYEARQALEAAERVEADDPGSDDARTLAYIAQRRAALAEVNARAAVAAAKETEARRELAEQRASKARNAPSPAR